MLQRLLIGESVNTLLHDCNCHVCHVCAHSLDTAIIQKQLIMSFCWSLFMRQPRQSVPRQQVLMCPRIPAGVSVLQNFKASSFFTSNCQVHRRM
jgi:hypothetical protein